MTLREVAIENIRGVARQLGPLRERAVFLGGSTTALLVTDPAAPDVRPTKDVDVVVQTSSLSESTRLDEELRELGFQHCLDPGAPACRWIVEDCRVDVITIGSGANTYNDRWTLPAVEHSERLELEDGLWISHVTAPYFIAIKLETFGDRGAGDYQGSQDIEDIIHVIDGRPELTSEIKHSEPDLHTYVSAKFHALLDSSHFLESLSAHLLPDAASQARVSLLLSRMTEIASPFAAES